MGAALAVIIIVAFAGAAIFSVAALVAAMIAAADGAVADDRVPARGPIRAIAHRRIARQEAENIDREYRALIAG